MTAVNNNYMNLSNIGKYTRLCQGDPIGTGIVVAIMEPPERMCGLFVCSGTSGIRTLYIIGLKMIYFLFYLRVGLAHYSLPKVPNCSKLSYIENCFLLNRPSGFKIVFEYGG